MQVITFPKRHSSTSAIEDDEDSDGEDEEKAPARTASLNHVLTNIVILQEFILELVAVLQVRAAVLGDREVQIAA